MADEEGPKLHRALRKKLLIAAHRYKQGGNSKLEAFTNVVAAFNEYARATNAPADVCLMLVDMIGEFANLGEGRPSKILTPQKTKNSPRTTVQREVLWAYAAVFVDYHGGTDKACRDAERKLCIAGCPLPRNSGFGTEVPGASIKNWRKQRKKSRRSKSIDQHFEAARDLVDKLARKSQIPQQKAAEHILDIAAENFG